VEAQLFNDALIGVGDATAVPPGARGVAWMRGPRGAPACDTHPGVPARAPGPSGGGARSALGRVSRDVLKYVKGILASQGALPVPQAASRAGLRRTPADQSLSAALEELEMAAFGAVAAAMKTSGIEASEVAPSKRLCFVQ
jgi:hypothetical protein